MSDRGSGQNFTAEEKAAMKERAVEARAEKKRGSAAEKAAADVAAVLEKIEELPEPERTLVSRMHELITAAVPALAPKTWYGMPAYAIDGKLRCFIQPAAKFKARYATLGFDENAALDDGDMWPTGYAVIELTPDVEKRITELVQRAAG